MRIAMVGTRGVPAAYGGFETAVEEIGKRLVEQAMVIVYTRAEDRQALLAVPGNAVGATACGSLSAKP